MNQRLLNTITLDVIERCHTEELTLFPHSVGKLASYIAKVVIPANPDGFTIDPETLQTPAFHKSVFLVSRKDREQRFYTRPGLMEVASWLRRNGDILYRPGHYIGGWRDNGIFFLDVTLSIRGMFAALNAAYANRQRAIYHPFSGNSFYLPEVA
ncbi:MAG: hypothetical protein FJ263_03635 [Planctomycetes bacterium]|nr:hypothetical protein [Planctomycetota bacterium]